MKRIATAVVCLLGLGVVCSGCDRPASAVSADPHLDSAHDHGHHHGPGHSHDHQHGPGVGEGHHDHTHRHRHDHDQGPHGGQIVAIGHVHHARGETHFYAEIMPIVENRITLHLLSENAQGERKPHPGDVSELTAYLDRLDRDSSHAAEIVFQVARSGVGTLSAAIPESFLESQRLLVVVPRIELGGERLSFSFSASVDGSQANSADPKGASR